eukprot:2516422-Alexandrium_andersonii.AAC.1
MPRHSPTPTATNPLRSPRQQLQTRPKHLLPDRPPAQPLHRNAQPQDVKEFKKAQQLASIRP